jgi:hypothetical protein
MGPTWKSVVLAVAIWLSATCSAQGQPVPFVADADARACLARSYSAIPQVRGSQPARSNDRRITDADRASAATPANRMEIVEYVAGLELLLAAMAAIACWLALVVAGAAVKRQRRGRPATVSAKSSVGLFVLLPAKKFPI